MTTRRGTHGTSVLLVGGGGHAKVCADVLRSMGRDLIGCVADRSRDDLGIPWLGTPEALDRGLPPGVDAAFVAVGDNRARLTLIDRLISLGIPLTCAVSPHAVVSDSATLGAGVAILPGAVVNAGAALRDGVIVNTRASVDHDSVVGRGAHIAPGCAVAGGVTIGEGTLLGIGSAVVPCCRIGRWCVVGAGAAVTADLPDGCRALGVPARPSFP
jgi:UDP-perosamine 4-acetyltransferase